ncbi:MAG: C69 family dipeptidase [Caldicoprobacterales bacterium]
MCDTMVALGNSTANGRVLFAKNSDRQPNECHIMVRVPRRKYPKGSKVKCTYIEVDQAEETYEVLLLKPHWIWGAEMGCNEYGLNIGNEAVFTKEPYAKDSLIGMDMLRIALERCKTGREALELLIELLERYGQGGNCGYEKPFTYHNSFLIADRSSAWVLETAGVYWAALQVKDIYSISNRLSIGREYDMAHPRLISHAIEKGWCRSNEDFDFSKCYSNKLITRLSGSQERQSCSLDILKKNKGNIKVETMINILRSHTPDYEKKPYRKSSVSSICMHAGFLYGDQTTGTYVVSLGAPDDVSVYSQNGLHENINTRVLDTYWITGSSAPCLSLFKPFWMIDGENMSFEEDNADAAVSYWKRQEEIHRCILEQRINADEYKKDRDQLEKSIMEKVAAADIGLMNSQQLSDIMEYTLYEEKKLQEKYLSRAKAKGPAPRGNLYFNHYWRKMNGNLHKS